MKIALASDAFVIRNTFLELPDDAIVPAVESRSRSVSDYTDARRIRSWSNCSDQFAWAHPVKNLEAVMEAESDTDVPDEEDELTGFDRSQSLNGSGKLFHTATSSSIMSLANDNEDTLGDALSAEMLALLQEDELDCDCDANGSEDACRVRARTSSSLFWIGHETRGLQPLVDEDASPMKSEQTEASDVEAVAGSESQFAAASFMHSMPPELYMQSLVPAAYMGCFLPPNGMWPAPMPWYACQSGESTSSSPVPQLSKPHSSSSLELPGSDTEQGKPSKRRQRRGARQSVWQSPSDNEEAQSEPTTVMLRNLPNRYTRKMFLRMLDLHGFSCEYDFVYLPIDFKHSVNLGYAFVNMASHESAVRLKSTLNGFSAWAFDSQKVCEAVWASPHQGLAPNIERYRDSPVMHASVADEFKPLLFKDGVRVAFPPPTKNIRAPKARETGGGDHA